ncbi:MAG: glutamine synthetase family protein [Steroidobacteraceae bacterium]
MNKATKRVPEELQKFLDRYPDTRQLELLQPDMLGILRGKRVGRDEFSKPFTGGLNFCGATVLLDARGMTFDRIDNGGRDGDPDAISTAVPGSLAPVPWAQVPTAQLLLAMNDSRGGPFFADPRQVLRHAMKPLQAMGLTAVAATELEFYLLEPDTDHPTPKVGLIPGTRKVQTGLQYGNMEDVEDADPFLADLFATCQAQNIPAGATLKEFSPGQFEINLHHVASAELAADHGVLLKRAVKAIARKHGMAASFMAKPFGEWAGCSLHVHVSLVDSAGHNIFSGTSSDGPFSDTLRHAIGGLAAAMPESMAIFAPTANSYRRYRPGAFVPLAPNWGRNHRGVALRIPMSGTEDTRVEYRPGGADGNPYLVLAAILAGIHHGIANRVEPGPMVAQESIIDEKIELPVRWSAALDAYDAGTILPSYLGEKYHRLYGTCRREEEERFHSEIGDRDYEWYLRAV